MMTPARGAVVGVDRASRASPQGARRLLSATSETGARGLAEHRRTYAPPRGYRRGRAEIIETVAAAGLRGRGGAGFPTATKLRAVAAGRGRAVVVVNGTEGEPTSRKDRLLLARAPHLVLDGAALAAQAVGAERIIVCVDRSATAARASIDCAIAERERAEPPTVDLASAALPPRYVAGEESALVHWLNGGEAKPTMVPPRPFERGVGGQPTLVSNVETLAHLAQIVRWGSAWFREQGTAEEPGTTLATVGGGVGTPSVVEVGIGASLPEVVRAASGPVDGVQAVLVGGYFGAWISGHDAINARLSNDSLRPFGAAVGCAAISVLPRSACGVVETARILGWFAAEGAGQCGSCVHGLAAIADGAADLLRNGPVDVAQLEAWGTMVEGRGACHLPTGAVRFLRSALDVFADDIARHRRGHHCEASHHEPLLPVPSARGPVEWR